MRSSFFAPLVAAGLVQLASATNGCNANNCARAVTGTSDGSASVSLHKADCSAAMGTAAIVTPSPVLVTDTVTITASAALETISTVVDVVSSYGSTQTERTTVVGTTAAVTSTVTAGTATAVVTATVSTATVVATVTVAATTTVQATTTVGRGSGSYDKYHWKRDGSDTAAAVVEAAIDEGDLVFQRVDDVNSTESTSPAKLKGRTYESTMSLASGVPTYAYYCTDYAAYTSACSCWGISAVTATASAETSTVTETVTVTPTESVVATVTSVDVETATTVATDVVPTTTVVVVSVTATSTRTVSLVATVSSTVTATKTTTVTGSTCTKKEVVATATPTSKGSSSGSCSFNVYSSKQVTPYGGRSSTCQQSSVDGCLNACGKDKTCNIFSYSQGSGKCTLYSGVSGFDTSSKSGGYYGCLKSSC